MQSYDGATSHSMMNEEFEKIMRSHQSYLKYPFLFWRCADFRGLDFRNWDFIGRDFRHADFRDCDLRGATLERCNLMGADFLGAKLDGVELLDCTLRYIDIISSIDDYIAKMFVGNNYRYKYCVYNCDDGKTHEKYYRVTPRQKPHGNVTGYKVVYVGGAAIARLVIPVSAEKVIYEGFKCRANKAYVAEIYSPDNGNIKYDEAVSAFNSDFIYKVGEIVESDDWNPNPMIECTNGIHFFLTEEEVRKYI